MSSFRNVIGRFSYSKYTILRQCLKKTDLLSSCSIRRHYPSFVNQDYTPEKNEEDESTLGLDELYPGHIPTSMLQRALLAVGSAGVAIMDPSRDDMICVMGETTGYYALKSMKDKMLKDPVGKQILQEKPEISTETVPIEGLANLPEGTFGHEYWKYLDKNGFSPDARLPVHFVDDPELRYVMLRYRQIHDLTHTILGMKPNMLGEVVVKWFEGIQTGLPMCVLGGIFGPLRLGPVHSQRYLKSYLPWVIRCAQNSKFLMAVYFEKHWETDIEQLRRELNIEPPPSIE